VLTNADILHDSQILTIQTDITNLETSKQDTINVSNLLSSTLVETNTNETLDTK
jgi:hypothetical protein